MNTWLPRGPIPAIIGGIVGGGVGYVAFFVLARLGLYALALPGAVLGLGCGMRLDRASTLAAVLCGVAGLALGVFTEWQFAPFRKDESLLYFITHLLDLSLATQLMIGLGTVFAAWFGRGRTRAML